MVINGCTILSTLCADNPEGFSSTVARGDVVKGPFTTIEAAQRYAMSWTDPANPPAIPAVTEPSPSPVVNQPVPEQIATVVHEAS